MKTTRHRCRKRRKPTGTSLLLPPELDSSHASTRTGTILNFLPRVLAELVSSYEGCWFPKRSVWNTPHRNSHGLACLNDNLFVTDPHLNEIRVFDTRNQQLLRIIHHPTLRGPKSLSIIHEWYQDRFFVICETGLVRLVEDSNHRITGIILTSEKHAKCATTRDENGWHTVEATDENNHFYSLLSGGVSHVQAMHLVTGHVLFLATPEHLMGCDYRVKRTWNIPDVKHIGSNEQGLVYALSGEGQVFVFDSNKLVLLDSWTSLVHSPLGMAASENGERLFISNEKEGIVCFSVSNKDT